MSLVKAHLPCPDCGSSDALSQYDDHTYCFSCSKRTNHLDAKPVSIQPRRKDVLSLITDGHYSGLPNRKITEETCQKFGYQVGKVDGVNVHIAPYRDKNNRIVAQKVRMPGKKFSIRGDFSEAVLFGQHMWKAGKRVVVVEGEIDALAYGQCAPGWAVVSVPNGAQSAKRSIEKSIDFLEGFEEVCFMFDNDEPGQKAARECAELITPGKASIATLPLKDASDMLRNNRVKELLQCVYNAKVHRPDGIVNGKELWDAVSKPQEMGIQYPFASWNEALYGLHRRSILTLTAGSGVGKSTIAAQIAYHLAVKDEKTIGYVALEESIERTSLRFMSLALGKPLHLPQDIGDEDRRVAFDKTLGTGRFLLYDHFGSLDSDHLLYKLKYMVSALGAQVLVIDHLSILLSGGDFMVSGGDERKTIDYTMTKLRSFVEQTGVSLILISHLKRPSGDKGYEDGIEPTLSSLRGSQSIAQLSDAVVSISRNASDGDNKLKVRCLKNRYSGVTGPLNKLRYDPNTATLEEVLDDFEDDEECDEL
jgi:twinkle protein